MISPTHHRLVCWLRPLAFLGVTAAVIAIWKTYIEHAAWHGTLPGYMLHSLAPLYADWMAPHGQGRPPMVPAALDLWNSPIVDRFVLAVLTATLAASLTAWSTARRLWTPVCLIIAVLAVFVTNVAVARIPNGYRSLVEPFQRPSLEYFPNVSLVGDKPITFIQRYAQLNRIRQLGHHPGTHPPGGVLFLWLGEKWFDTPPKPTLSGAFSAWFGDTDEPLGENAVDVAAWWAIGFTALGLLPAWWLARVVGGAAAARRILPLYVVAPNLVLFGATSMDGVFLVFTLCAMAAGVMVMRRGWSCLWTPLLTLVAGALLWLAAFMTFAAVAVPIVMGCYALCAGIRRPMRGVMMLARCVLVGVVFVGCQIIASHVLKYDLRAVADAAMNRDYSGVRVTGYESFAFWRDLSVANLLAFLVGSGVAVIGLASTALAVSLAHARLRGSGLASFTPAVALGVAILAMSTLFTLETERVWLFMTPVVLVAATSQFRGRFVWCAVIAISFAQVFWIQTQYYVYW